MLNYLLAISSLFILWLLKKFVNASFDIRRYGPLPPGPKPKPFVGNAFDFPLSFAHERYIEWGKKYQSDLLYASALGNKVLILNNLKDADALLDGRSRKYSDRPDVPVVRLMEQDWNMAIQRYDESWRFHRKICQQNFRAEAAREYHPLLLKKTHELLRRLLEKPDRFEEHSKLFSIAIPMITMYGYEVESLQDPCVTAAEEVLRISSPLVLPGGSWINVIPALAYVPPWFPGATSSKIAARVRKINKDMQRIPFEFTKKGVEEGTAITSFMSKCLRQKFNGSVSEEQERAVRNIANTVYSAASDTVSLYLNIPLSLAEGSLLAEKTISTNMSFFYLMAIHPEIQRKAQAQIDAVVGSNRLPELEDRASLPYIDAIYREVLRYQPPLPLCVPHAVTEDDYYKGFHIPKDTVVLPNIWAMTHDENRYSEPYKFIPERFLDEAGNLNNDSRVLAYGFGRRVCVGKYIGSATLWLVMVSVLACFNIEKCKDEFGNEIEINDDYDDRGVFLHKSKFRCAFVPRSETAKRLILGTAS